MEVSQLASLDTHAVIGGEDPEAFGITDDAEMYEMLSSALYRDKKRAAMRETICNGWDSHIVGGKTDIPLEITVTDDEIIIKDFGSGIPHHKMKPIYCVYGRSTKVKDANQTGGFGLGSKSPFAVTDHFSVVSCFEGLRSVYALSRGGKATDGKPDCRRMVSVPTDDTGITVTIPMRDKKERGEFEMHIRAVVKQGGMLANLNGVLLPRFDYTAARKTEYCVIPAELRESMVYVLYGTVLYPLTTTDENMLDLVNEAGRLIGLNSRLILIAPPNSVGVTPSRESLSYTELTTATLERLLKKAIKQIGAARPAAANRFLRKWVTNAGRSGITARVDGRNEYPADVLSTPAAIADHAIVCDPDRHIEGVNRRKYKIAATVFKDDRRFFRRAIKSHDALSTYTFRRSAQPALRIAAKMGLLKDFYAFKCYEYYREHSGPKTVPLKELPGEGNIQPVLCIAKNLRDLRPTFSSNSDTSYRTEANTYMVGFVLRQWTEKNLKELRALCERFKIGLIEFDYEEARLNRLANKPVRREKVEDTYQALEAFRARGSTEADPSCTTPTAYLMGWQRDGKYHLPFADWCVSDLSKVYPNTVVITTKAQEEKLQKFGLKNLTETLAARLTELAKLREVQYGFAVWQGKMTKHEWSDDIGYVALKLSQGDMEIAKLLFPDKVTPGAAFTEAKLLYNVLTSLTHQPDEVRKLATAATVALATASASTFPQLTIEQTKRKFRYLALLRGAGVVGEITSSLKAELIETIKFLQLHHSKSKLTVKSVPTEAVAIAHKEAA